MLELVAGVLLTAAAVYYVLRPILRPDTTMPARAGVDIDEGDDLEDEVSPRAQALRALREVEFDRATGKLSDADYDALRVKYTALALEALRAETGAAARPPADAPVAAAAAQRPASRAPGPVCPTDGPRPEADAIFCSACGRRLGAGAGYCARCGTTLEPDASFCSRCGARAAA